MAAVAFETLALWLLQRALELLPQWLPEGKLVGREWCVGNVQGERGQSLKINIDSGLWSDFGAGIKGRDLIALWAAIHQLTQVQAARQLAEKYGYGPLDTSVVPLRPAVSDAQPAEEFEWPPSDAPLQDSAFRHPKHGTPSRWFPYRTPDRRLIYVIARYELPDGKTFAPWTWREGRWRMKAHPAPRPLYGLDRLESYPGATIIVEGEGKADALQGVTQRSSVVAWAGGANSWKHADWSVLRGRTCILWPDADTPGFFAMQSIAGLLIALGCALQIINTDGLPDGFDAANLVQQDPSSSTINSWIRARLKPVALATGAVQSVLVPRTIAPAVTLNERGERLPEAEADAPAYSVAARYGLSFNKSGVHANLANARALLEGRIAEGRWEPLYYDDFLHKVIAGEHLREWSDHDTLRITNEMQRQFSMTALRKGVVDDAVSLYAFEHRRNSAQEWLRSLEWDHTARLEQLFTAGFGAEANDYTRAVGRCFLTGLVARVLDPGCQVDTLPVLEGEQGIRKSSALRVLGGVYHAECQESAGGKDFYLVLAGKMLVEIAELHSFKRTDIERVNGIITCRADRYRAPYERRASDHLRACVFVATTNKDDWNHDETGARRFWPIRCQTISVDWIQTHRTQLFAEAVARYIAGESWWNVPEEQARLEQANRRQEDVIGANMRYYCERNGDVTVAGVIEHALHLNGVHAYDRGLQQRITNQLRAWGYRSRFGKSLQDRTARVWERADGHLPISSDDEPY